MRKKILTALSLGALLTTSLTADSCQINSGAYAGVGVGIANLSGKRTFQHDNTNVPPTNNKANLSLSKTSGSAGVFAGYGMKSGSMWAAAELLYQIDQLNDKGEFYIANPKIKTLKSNSTGAFGASVHLGFAPTNACLAYAILGLEVRSFKVEFSDSDRTDISATIKKTYSSMAFSPGLGARFALSKNLSARAEYKYAMHPNKTLASTGRNPGGYDDKVNVKHSPVVQSLNIGLVYSF